MMNLNTILKAKVAQLVAIMGEPKWTLLFHCFTLLPLFPSPPPLLSLHPFPNLLLSTPPSPPPGVGGFLPAVKQIANVAALPGIVGVSAPPHTHTHCNPMLHNPHPIDIRMEVLSDKRCYCHQDTKAEKGLLSCVHILESGANSVIS